jgi:hypothetical protein
MSPRTQKLRGWWEETTADGASIRYRFGTNEAGDVAVVEVRITASDITTNTLRAIQPGKAIARARWERASATVAGPTAHLVISAVAPPTSSLVVGRPDGTDPKRFYARFADAYRAAAYQTSAPIPVLAEANDVPSETVRRWVKEARRRGDLPAGRKGRAG